MKTGKEVSASGLNGSPLHDFPIGTGKSAHCTLEIGNITNLGTHLYQVGENQANVFVFQEHSCPPGERAKIYKYLRSRRKETILGPLDPEAKHNLAGVGVTSQHWNRVIRVLAKSASFTAATQTGRADCYAIDIW